MKTTIIFNILKEDLSVDTIKKFERIFDDFLPDEVRDEKHGNFVQEATLEILDLYPNIRFKSLKMTELSEIAFQDFVDNTFEVFVPDMEFELILAPETTTNQP